jgi:hypothetical protein
MTVAAKSSKRWQLQPVVPAMVVRRRLKIVCRFMRTMRGNEISFYGSRNLITIPLVTMDSNMEHCTNGKGRIIFIVTKIQSCG